jgi:hypothetical protein
MIGIIGSPKRSILDECNNLDKDLDLEYGIKTANADRAK